MLIDLLQAHDDATRLIESGRKHRVRVLWIRALFRRPVRHSFPLLSAIMGRRMMIAPQKVCRRIDPARYQSCASGPLFPVEPK